MKEPICAALVGAGSFGSLRATALGRSPSWRLVAVADARVEAASELAVSHGAEPFSDWREMVESTSAEVVVISNPPDCHAEVALVAAANGKHILCEKPLANSVEAAVDMCHQAEENGVLLKTGFNHRYFPAVAFAQRLVADGEIGDIIRVRARGGHQGGTEFGHDWVHDGEVTGGGCLVDNGIHLLDLVRFFIGDVEAAKGYVDSLVWPFESAEDNAWGLFRGSSGALAMVEASWTEWRGYFFSVEVVGTRGVVTASYPPMLARWGRIPEPGHRVRMRTKIFPLFQIHERLRSWRWTIIESLIQEQEEFATGIRSGRPVPATGVDGLRTLQMADAVYRSSERGEEILLQNE
jgi:predicted dehydrogenase